MKKKRKTVTSEAKNKPLNLTFKLIMHLIKHLLIVFHLF